MKKSKRFGEGRTRRPELEKHTPKKTSTKAAEKMLVRTLFSKKNFFRKNLFCHCQMHRHPPHGLKYMESEELEIIPTIKSYPLVYLINSAFSKNARLMTAAATLTRETSHAPSWPHERCFQRQSSQDDFHESRCFS